ncbi:thermonuclease family protein [Heliobacterium chlorum]|uniref:Thermonuclease family protein n=1 Tax=Heliobacterium chlorum TaxID=2698 RepID=A0ABR7T411_HELCL|nr:thermonuclease family protein [Heliobacterium chlorum]MBC9785518.1 thermonuclease family protein [Heliobacterium chlorum]
MFVNYTYNAIVTRVIDGDTFDADIDLGFNVIIKERFRLYGLNALEIHGEEKGRGELVKQWLAGKVEGQPVTINSVRKEKYGRWLAVVHHKGNNVNDEMLAEGLAVSFMK